MWDLQSDSMFKFIMEVCWIFVKEGMKKRERAVLGSAAGMAVGREKKNPQTWNDSKGCGISLPCKHNVSYNLPVPNVEYYL